MDIPYLATRICSISTQCFLTASRERLEPGYSRYVVFEIWLFAYKLGIECLETDRYRTLPPIEALGTRITRFCISPFLAPLFILPVLNFTSCTEYLILTTKLAKDFLVSK